MLFIFPEIPRLVHPCYLGRMGAPLHNQIYQLSINYAVNLLSECNADGFVTLSLGQVILVCLMSSMSIYL